MTVNNGSNVIFNCVSFSYDIVTYMWLKNGEIPLDDDINVIISTDSDEDNNNYTIATTVMILDVQLYDNVVYICSVTNREGTTLSNAATLVTGKL